MECKKNIINIEKLQDFFRDFVEERQWTQFHTPKNLAIALAVESSELLEIFQWLSDKESQDIMKNPKKQQDIKDEIADIFCYLIRLADVLNIDIEEAFWEKFKKNKEKYPVHLCKGSNLKYTELLEK